MSILNQIENLISEDFIFLQKQLIKINSDSNYFFIDGNNIKDKSSFMKEFFIKLKFPEYFNFNWDSFYDCLTDLSWLDIQKGLLVIYNNSQKFRSNNQNEWKTTNDILLNAVDYWKQNSKSMIIAFS